MRATKPALRPLLSRSHNAMRDAPASAGFGSDRYRLVQALAHSIDALAQDITGDPARRGSA